MSRLRVSIAALAITAASLLIGVQPAAATTYQVSCWSTSGSPYVSRTGTGTTAWNAAINCTRNLGTARWTYSTCVASATIWQYTGGYYYGQTVKKQVDLCGYGSASFTTQGYLSSYW